MRCARILQWLFVGAASAALAASADAQTTLHVDDDAGPGGDGLTWETAYRFLQDGLAHAAGSMGVVEEIRVAQGTYTPDLDDAGGVVPGDRTATFQLLSGLQLLGGFEGVGAEDPDSRDVDLFPSILTGDLLGNDGADFVNYDENSYHVVTGSGTDLSAVIDGFTITGGRANGPAWPAHGTLGAGMVNVGGSPTVSHCTFSVNWAQGFGGAMENLFGASPHISDCLFVGNLVSPGDAGFVSGGAIESIGGTDVVITDSQFVNNVANGGVVTVWGGAISLQGPWDDPPFETGSLTLIGCSFTGNSGEGGGGEAQLGGAVMVNGSDSRMERCTFEDNRTTGPGSSVAGAVIVAAGGVTGPAAQALTAEIVDCTFSGNESGWGGAVYVAGINARLVGCNLLDNAVTNNGGAMYAWSWPEVGLVRPMAINCVFDLNSAGNMGGAMIIRQNVRMELVNCTLMHNVAATGSVLRNENGGATISRNSIFWYNRGGPLFSGLAPLVTYSDVEGGYAGAGNIDQNPMCIDGPGGNLRLGASSPCIDAGHNWSVPQDTLDLDDDGVTNELIPVDLDGNPRFNADEVDFNPGCGVPVVVDMGAYEYQFDPVDQVLFADVNGDGAVDVADLVQVILDWGGCGECCLSDLDLDGMVGVAELVEVVLNWN